MLWIEKMGVAGGQATNGNNSPEHHCSICGEIIANDSICIGVRKVHDLAHRLPFHPARSTPVEEYDENYFTNCKHDNEFIHLNCYPYQFVRPYACMFDEHLSNASSEEIQSVKNNISKWQLQYRKLNALTKKRKAQEEDGDEENSSSPAPKKTKTSTTASKRRKRTSKSSVGSSSATTDTTVTDHESETSLDYTSMESPYLFGLSDDAWYEILSYLPHYSLVHASEACKALYFYTGRSILWESLAICTLCPSAKKVQQDFFPTLSNDFKKVFILLYGNCCVVCGSYIRKGAQPDNRMSLCKSKGSIEVESSPLYYNFLLDQCQCSACNSSPLVETITRTNAKKLYNVVDSELGCTRFFAKPNPYSPSVAMGLFLKLQVEVLHLRKMEEVLRQNFRKSKVHFKEEYMKIIEKGKRGDYGKSCKLYIYLNASDKKICKDNSIYTYIDSLSP